MFKQNKRMIELQMLSTVERVGFFKRKEKNQNWTNIIQKEEKK